MKQAVALAAVVALAAAALAAIALGGAEATAVRVAAPALRDIRPSVFAAGRIVHADEVRLGSEVVGKVKAVHVVEGEAVERGRVLLVVDDAAYAAQVAQSRAAVRLREIDLRRKRLAIDDLHRQSERSRRLFERDMLDAHAFEAAAHRLRLASIDLDSGRELLAQAQAELAHAEERLDKTRLRAPIAGVVTSLDIEVGETAIAGTMNVPGSTLMVIADPRSMVAEVHVDEADAARVRVGQPAQVVAIAYGERRIEGEVAFIANAARRPPNRGGLSFRVRIRLHRPGAPAGDALRSGVSCRAEIFLAGGGEVLSLPIAAIVSEDDIASRSVRHYVYVARAGSAAKTRVELGRADDEFQEVLSGIAAEDRVVVGPGRALRYLRDGAPIDYATASRSPRDSATRRDRERSPQDSATRRDRKRSPQDSATRRDRERSPQDSATRNPPP